MICFVLFELVKNMFNCSWSRNFDLYKLRQHNRRLWWICKQKNFAYSQFADSETHLIPLSLPSDFLFFQPADSHWTHRIGIHLHTSGFKNLTFQYLSQALVYSLALSWYVEVTSSYSPSAESSIQRSRKVHSTSGVARVKICTFFQSGDWKKVPRAQRVRGGRLGVVSEQSICILDCHYDIEKKLFNIQVQNPF